MTDILRPDNRQYVDDVLAQIKSRQSVYVEGPTGSGRGTMLDALREAGGVVLELLALEESDASAVALLEMYSWSSADLQLSRGTDAEAYSAAFQALRALAGHEGAFLVARLPASWKLLERQVDTDDAVPRRARAVFNALLHSELPIVLIADAAIRCSDLGFHPSLRITLPPHEVPLSALGSIEWEAYERSFAALSEAAPELRASPLTWRLAIGLVGLGARPAAVVSQLPRLSLLELARKVGRWIWSRWPALLDRLSLFQAIRRPVGASELAELLAVAPEHLPLFNRCLAYGGETLKVAPVVRRGLRYALEKGGTSGAAKHHATLAQHYESLDGAASPRALPTGQVRSWCEKVHHLALSDSEKWQEQELPTPEQYWDRARYLSRVSRQYLAAAGVYKRCLAAFPDDDYAWHYLAWNLHQARDTSDSVESAYRQAVALDPDNPWWNSRLVTFLIARGKPSAARDEWRRAIVRVDPDGEAAAESTWLARNLHRWVIKEWARAGRGTEAARVLRQVPRHIRAHDTFTKLRGLVLRSSPRDGAEPPRFRAYLRTLEERGLSPSFADGVRQVWQRLRRLGGDDLPLPIAQTTADGERFQFAWSYVTVLLEVEVMEDGRVVWFGRDRRSGISDGSENPSDGLPTELDGWLTRVIDA